VTPERPEGIHVTRDWTWDPTLYQGSATYYQRGRLPYAPGLAEAMSRALDLSGHDRLLDVGCGPGTLTLILAPLFQEAIGLDPDPGMLAEARRLAEERDQHNIRWVQARAEDLPAGLGTFTIATFGQSFHWMERDKVAAAIREMLLPGGAFVQVSDVKNGSVPEGEPLPYPATPYPAIRDLVRARLGPVRRAGQGALVDGTPSDEAAVLARHGFRRPTRIRVPAGAVIVREIEDVLAWVYSRSDSAPHLFGSQRAQFEQDLRALLAETSPTGRFAEYQPDTEIIIWRPTT
jgi:SAM-dependent methyltransferase